ncbi:hypothetical protein [Pseudomonas sp. B1-22]|uniref:hypothetical protein n=1 Tax=Pseudomonas sp. B1-22 TaxID=3141456 RepID=UPI003D29D87D
MLNGLPLNSAALNALWQLSITPPEPVAAPTSLVWACRVRLGVENVSAQLTGKVRIEREEGAAAIAELSLYLPEAGVDVVGWTGRPLEIYFQHLVDGVWVEERRFSGWLEQPTYDPRNRIVACEATDRLQDLVEAMEIDAIDLLAGGVWSEDVFEALDGRSRWDYAMERMGTLPASLDRSVAGALRVTPWARKAPIKVFGPGTTIDQSLSVEIAKLSDRVNRVELSIDYRYSRLRQRSYSYSWQHPDIEGWSESQGFCLWRHNTTELPTIDMITDALSSAGLHSMGGSFLTVPLSGVYCDPPQGWTNQFDNLVLAFGVAGGVRWVQPITEKYVLTVEAPPSIAQAGEVIRRDGTAVESELDRADNWESEDFSTTEPDAVIDELGDAVINLREPERLSLAIRCQLATSAASILSAHRGTRVGFQVPTSMALGIDLVHTVRLEDRCTAEGKTWSIIDELDIDNQTAISTLTLAISRGGGEAADPLLPPAPPATNPGGPVPAPPFFSTQLRGRGLMTYDDEREGFAGNYDEVDAGTPVDPFPRRLQMTAPDIPAEQRDEYTAEKTATYRVAIPDDPLVL